MTEILKKKAKNVLSIRAAAGYIHTDCWPGPSDTLPGTHSFPTESLFIIFPTGEAPTAAPTPGLALPRQVEMWLWGLVALTK